MPPPPPAAAVAAAGMTAFLRPSTAPFLYPKHRFSPRFSRPCTLSSPSSQVAIPNVVDILRERGLVESITSDNLRPACSNPNSIPFKVYCGFDPTAESLHLGNLIGLIVLAWFRRCGHKTVALIGGATGRIGDPSGKSLERPELDVETIEKNSAEIRDLRGCFSFPTTVFCFLSQHNSSQHQTPKQFSEEQKIKQFFSWSSFNVNDSTAEPDVPQKMKF